MILEFVCFDLTHREDLLTCFLSNYLWWACCGSNTFQPNLQGLVLMMAGVTQCWGTVLHKGKEQRMISEEYLRKYMLIWGCRVNGTCLDTSLISFFQSCRITGPSYTWQSWGPEEVLKNQTWRRTFSWQQGRNAICSLVKPTRSWDRLKITMSFCLSQWENSCNGLTGFIKITILLACGVWFSW